MSHILKYSRAYIMSGHFTNTVEAHQPGSYLGCSHSKRYTPPPPCCLSMCSHFQVSGGTHRRHRKKQWPEPLLLRSHCQLSQFGLSLTAPLNTQCHRTPDSRACACIMLQVNLQPSCPAREFHWCHPWLQKCPEPWGPKGLDGKSQGSPSHIHVPRQFAQL